MTEAAHIAIDDALHDLPLEDRTIALAASVVRGRGAVRAIGALIAMVAAMAYRLPQPERVGIAEAMRGAADRVEARR